DYNQYLAAIPNADERTLYVYFRRYLLQRKMGLDGTSELAKAAGAVPDGWAKAVGLYLSGTLGETELFAKATAGDATTVINQQCHQCYNVHRVRACARRAC